MIKKFGKLYKVLSKSGKNLGTSKSKIGAEKRLKQTEYFKNRKRKKYLLDGRFSHINEVEDEESES